MQALRMAQEWAEGLGRAQEWAAGLGRAQVAGQGMAPEVLGQGTVTGQDKQGKQGNPALSVQVFGRVLACLVSLGKEEAGQVWGSSSEQGSGSLDRLSEGDQVTKVKLHRFPEQSEKGKLSSNSF